MSRSATVEKPIAQSKSTGLQMSKVKARKRALFELWHKEKLAEIESYSRKCANSCDLRLSMKEEPDSDPDPQPPVSSPSSISADAIIDKTPILSLCLQSPSPAAARTQNCSTDPVIDSSMTTPLQSSGGIQYAPCSVVPSLPTLLSQPTQLIRSLTSPKLSRHNDAAFYPNIQCILCNEWVCSRNRFMHIESHLQYRPYKCNMCGYDNRKQIFIDLHIKRVHNGTGKVLYLPDAELEKRAWSIAEQCLQHTRDVLMNDSSGVDRPDSIRSVTNGGGDSPAINDKRRSSCAAVSQDLIKPYKDFFRPQIFNNQRAEKSQLIEETRQLGLIPDFSAVAGREERCQLCQSYVLRNQSLLEEHVRSHLSKPTYRCLLPKCSLVHFSRSFIQRHTKEVHKTRKTAVDLLEHDVKILREFLKICPVCFPKFFIGANLERLKSNYLHILAYDCSHCESAGSADDLALATPPSSSSKDEQATAMKCLGCHKKLRLFPTDQQDVCSSCFQNDDTVYSGSIICKVCYDMVPGTTMNLEQHALKHMSTFPFQCAFCEFSDWNYFLVSRHSMNEHAEDRVTFKWEPTMWRTRWKLQFISCFGEAENNFKETPRVDDSLSTERCCTLCLKNVPDYPASLFQHTLKHVSSLVYYCIYCRDRFPEQNPLCLHIRSEHKDYPEILVTNNKEVEGERRRILAVCFPNC
ncbi:unnamed protein product [Soboliphyme baturini]|uniref:C2H2-type domain-containing protein n=1 Tax=Soboliphyme baturini TaxID=241478 RepID=A0A183IYU3_9BILA|nr:unnamed protein product [Soboliphyme baturini]